MSLHRKISLAQVTEAAGAIGCPPDCFGLLMEQL